MILKVQTGACDTLLFDNIKDLRYTSNGVTLPNPPKKALKDDEELWQWMATHHSDFSDDTLNTHFFGIMDDTYPESCYKRVTFTRKGHKHFIYTMYSVYVCNDQGKTIEAINNKSIA